MNKKILNIMLSLQFLIFTPVYAGAEIETFFNYEKEIVEKYDIKIGLVIENIDKEKLQDRINLEFLGWVINKDSVKKVENKNSCQFTPA